MAMTALVIGLLVLGVACLASGYTEPRVITFGGVLIIVAVVLALAQGLYTATT